MPSAACYAPQIVAVNGDSIITTSFYSQTAHHYHPHQHHHPLHNQLQRAATVNKINSVAANAAAAMAMVSHHASVAGPQMFNNDGSKPTMDAQVINNNNGMRNSSSNFLRQNQMINNLNVSLFKYQKLLID